MHEALFNKALMMQQQEFDSCSRLRADAFDDKLVVLRENLERFHLEKARSIFYKFYPPSASFDATKLEDFYSFNEFLEIFTSYKTAQKRLEAESVNPTTDSADSIVNTTEAMLDSFLSIYSCGLTPYAIFYDRLKPTEEISLSYDGMLKMIGAHFLSEGDFE